MRQATGEALWGGEQQAGGTDTNAAGRCSAGFQVGWELDFWGKFRRGIEAADAGYFASIAQYDDLQVLMAAQVASLYCSIRTLEARLVIARENAALQKRSLEIAERLFKGGDESELDVQQAQGPVPRPRWRPFPRWRSRCARRRTRSARCWRGRPGPLPEMAAGKDAIPQAGAGRHRRHAGRPAAAPAGHPRGGDAAGGAVRADRRERGRPLSLDLAAGLGGPVGHVAQRIAATSSAGAWARAWSGTCSTTAGSPTPCWCRTRASSSCYEQYQDAVLRAAREVDDAAVGFVKTGEQIVLLAESVKAAQRSLDIATIQYREGLIDFERVLDSQRVLFAQQDQLVTTRGGLTQNLIALYKAMGGGWEPGRGRPGAGRRDARHHEPAQRLEGPAVGAAAGARTPSPTNLRGTATMTDEPGAPAKPARPAARPRRHAAAAAATPGKGSAARRDHRAGADRRSAWPGTSSPTA